MVSLVLGNGRMRSMNKRVEGHFFPIVCFQIMTNVIVKREYLKEDFMVMERTAVAKIAGKFRRQVCFNNGERAQRRK